MADAAIILENLLPPADSAISQVKMTVRVPKRAGNRRIQNIPPPS